MAPWPSADLKPALVADPILIRRPLLQVEDRREAGFDQALVDAWIGLRPTTRPVTDARPRTEAPAAVEG
jgi:hypothetical protein